MYIKEIQRVFCTKLMILMQGSLWLLEAGAKSVGLTKFHQRSPKITVSDACQSAENLARSAV